MRVLENLDNFLNSIYVIIEVSKFKTLMLVYLIYGFFKIAFRNWWQFTQTNKKQPHVLHFKNNIYYFIL